MLATSPSLLLDPPYQRGPVWGERRRQNLVRSLLLGIPVGNVFLSTRDDAAMTTAVVDGRQRLETIAMFLSGDLPVPATWFPAEDVHTVEDTCDGPYVRYTGLGPRGQARFDRCSLTTQRCALATVEDEAALFALVNFGGLAQGERDSDV